MISKTNKILVFEVKKALIEALSIFLSVDQDLPMNIHERTSVSRIAHHLANIIETKELFSDNNIVVDVEYNRKGRSTKTLENKDIYTDLIVHRRGKDEENINNILICEFKNNSDSSSDAERITKMVRSGEYGYLVGAKLIINQLRNGDMHNIEVVWIE